MNSYKNTSEAVLVEKMQRGDEQALVEIIRRYETMIARIVIGMLGNTAEAEDVGQETFLRFWQSVGTYRYEAKVSTFLTRIAINLSINELRRRKNRYAWLELTDDKPIQYEFTDPQDAFQQADVTDQITHALTHIQTDQRVVVILRLIEGYSTRETADMLGIPLGTVLSRLSRGLEKMRKILRNTEQQ
ncbi:MAG: RNA polymerase sigma factor [Bacteroidales bacterium]|nr:RNA polymerase sigma factor [Bacteroidales bacterium]